MVERIAAARDAGFDAVECHWPFDTPAADIRAALLATGLSMLGLNTRRGNVGNGDNGLAALPGRETEARAAIDEALAYARATNTGAVHVMAGNSSGPRARAALLANLDYACGRAAPDGITILIEPLNPYNAPGYFLNGTGLAADIIREVAASNLRLMFDCYHIQILEGDVTRRLEALLPLVGHIQIASVPDRGPPDHGELDYDFVLDRIHKLGWDRPIGAEYVPDASADQQTGWLGRRKALRDDR
jgi:hydroxypyruvate isomerase